MKTNLCLRKQISHIVPDVVHGNMRPAVSIHTSHAFQYVSIYYLRAIIYAAAAWTTLVDSRSSSLSYLYKTALLEFVPAQVKKSLRFVGELERAH